MQPAPGCSSLTPETPLAGTGPANASVLPKECEGTECNYPWWNLTHTEKNTTAGIAAPGSGRDKVKNPESPSSDPTMLHNQVQKSIMEIFELAQFSTPRCCWHPALELPPEDAQGGLPHMLGHTKSHLGAGFPVRHNQH